MGEHSIIDGTPTVRMCSEALDALKNPSFDHGSEIATTLPPPAALDWNVSAETERAIGRATNEARELVGSQTLGYRTTSYGKKARFFCFRFLVATLSVLTVFDRSSRPSVSLRTLGLR
jgi:carnitine O-acetyltransferase